MISGIWYTSSYQAKLHTGKFVHFLKKALLKNNAFFTPKTPIDKS